MILDDVAGRDDVRQVMSRPEFQYPKSLGERLGEWISDLLDKLFGGRTPGVPSSFGGGLSPLLGYLMIIVVLGLLLVVIVIAVRHWRPRARDDEEDLSEVEAEHRRRAKEWANDAERFEAAGEWKLAMRARYRELVRTLVDRRQVADLAGRTTGELRADMALSTPSAEDDFDSACLLFELPWYAHVPTGSEQVARFRDLAAAVLDAPVEHRMGDARSVQLGRLSVEAGAAPVESYDEVHPAREPAVKA